MNKQPPPNLFTHNRHFSGGNHISTKYEPFIFYLHPAIVGRMKLFLKNVATAPV